MSLSQILDAVRAEFTAAGGRATFKLGGEHIAAQDAPPRIVWVPKGGAFGPVDKGGTNPRPLKTRNLRVEVHCWGKDYEAAEDLVNRISAAAHSVASGSMSHDNELWPEGNEQLSALGRVIILSFTFRVPVTGRTYATVTPTAATQTPEFTS